MHANTPQPQADGWQETRAETSVNTVLVRNAADYLEAEADHNDIGRQVADGQHELFVSCDPAEALQQQFDHLRPEFIALHDLGTNSSKKLLAAIAAASGQRVHTLTVRRQGYGTTLAALEFVELPIASGPKLRLYSTDCSADTPTRHALINTLLGYSQLGVLMTGDVVAHQLRTMLSPLREAMLGAHWPNRQLLLLPLASSSHLGQEGAELARGTGVHVRTAPAVARPADAWAFINSTWARLYAQAHPEQAALLAQRHAQAASAPAAPAHRAVPPLHAPAAAAPVQAPPQPSSPPRQASAAQPMPVLGMAVGADAVEPTLARYVRQLLELPGMVSCCVFDIANQRTLVHGGARPEGDALANHGAVLLAAMTQSSRTLGLGHTLPEAAITLGAHHLLLRAVPKHPGVALHAVLDKTHANLTLVRLQIGRMDALFDDAAR